ncbi:tetratricopeptide repeat protein [Polaromonas sp. YR568]|uniref:tetratricopeptide repeat protein n=1 Tax=Polaromonas sp. YR568 TaxID=1855301 RepID=UPI00398BF5C5
MALFSFGTPAQRFAKKFNRLRDTVHDTSARFKGSRMSADLAALQPLAEAVGADSDEMADLLWLQFVVFRKRQQDTEGLPLGLRALAMRAAKGNLTPTGRYEQHYAIGESALDAKEYDTAIEHLQQSAHWAAHEGVTLSVEQKLGLREEIGYALHEAGRFAEALAHNRQLFTDAQAAFGFGTDRRMSGVINNLAQNAHQLGKHAEAKTWMQQRLALGKALEDTDIVLDALFQLGVLAHETRRTAEARAFFQQRVDIARAADDEYLLESAQATLAEFEERKPQGKPR